MHEKNFVHRDLKPENILMNRENSVITLKIADFGVTRAVYSSKLATTTAGTPLHMAPEVLMGSQVGYDERADIWSLGTIFYQLLSGTEPFYAKNLEGLRQLMEQPPKRCPEMNDECWALLMGMLCVDPFQRFSAFRCLSSPLFDSCWHALGKKNPADNGFHEVSHQGPDGIDLGSSLSSTSSFTSLSSTASSLTSPFPSLLASSLAQPSHSAPVASQPKLAAPKTSAASVLPKGKAKAQGKAQAQAQAQAKEDAKSQGGGIPASMVSSVYDVSTLRSSSGAGFGSGTLTSTTASTSTSSSASLSSSTTSMNASTVKNPAAPQRYFVEPVSLAMLKPTPLPPALADAPLDFSIYVSMPSSPPSLLSKK